MRVSTDLPRPLHGDVRHSREPAVFRLVRLSSRGHSYSVAAEQPRNLGHQKHRTVSAMRVYGAANRVRGAWGACRSDLSKLPKVQQGSCFQVPLLAQR
jgi:hypothetical protein